MVEIFRLVRVVLWSVAILVALSIGGRIAGVKAVRDRTDARPGYIRDRVRQTGVSWPAHAVVLVLLVASILSSFRALDVARSTLEQSRMEIETAERISEQSHQVAVTSLEANRLYRDLVNALLREDLENALLLLEELDELKHDLYDESFFDELDELGGE